MHRKDVFVWRRLENKSLVQHPVTIRRVRGYMASTGKSQCGELRQFKLEGVISLLRPLSTDGVCIKWELCVGISQIHGIAAKMSSVVSQGHTGARSNLPDLDVSGDLPSRI
jgi:hypothetical protein